jgi:hypothetical protein
MISILAIFGAVMTIWLVFAAVCRFVGRLRFERELRKRKRVSRQELEAYRRKRMEIYRKMGVIRGPVIFLACLLFLPGCAHFASRTYEEGVDSAGKPVNRTTHMYVTTFFDSNTTLAKARNSPTITSSNQWAAGTMVGGLNQESSGTNTVALFQALSQIFGQLAASAAKSGL